MARRGRSFDGPVVRAIAAGFVLILGGVLAWHLRWVCDDIFITLRYVDHLAGGQGLVYNPGERVEGFTHPLWLGILALVQLAGGDPVSASLTLGWVSFVLVLGVFALISYRMGARGLPIVLPFASLALAANLEFRIWATSGLATAFFTLLVSLSFLVFFFTSWKEKRRAVLAGLFLSLAVLTRPDGVLFWGTGFLFLAGRVWMSGAARKEALRDLFLFTVPFLLTVIPYQILRMSYFGDVYPNTYYAKSAGQAYFSQGFYFLWLYFKAYPTSFLFLLSVPLLVTGFRRPGNSAEDARGWFAALAALAGVLVYLVLFVARVGGGFMYARLLVPVLPFVYFLIEWSVRRLGRNRGTAALAVLLAVPILAGTVERTRRDHLLLETGEGKREIQRYRGILDEHSYYTEWYRLEDDRLLGRLLRPVFQGLDAVVLLRGQACFGYYANFRTCIENNGLTDRTIARLPLESRKRIGHEKSAPYDYLVERGVHFVFRRSMYREKNYRMALFILAGNIQVPAEIITYDPELMDEISRRMGDAFRYIPFDQYLDAYIEQALPSRNPAEIEADFRDFKDFYFDRTPDPARRQVFEEAIAGS